MNGEQIKIDFNTINNGNIGQYCEKINTIFNTINNSKKEIIKKIVDFFDIVEIKKYVIKHDVQENQIIFNSFEEEYKLVLSTVYKKKDDIKQNAYPR